MRLANKAAANRRPALQPGGSGESRHTIAASRWPTMAYNLSHPVETPQCG